MKNKGKIKNPKFKLKREDREDERRKKYEKWGPRKRTIETNQS